jgi:hypothetical protein
MMGPKWFNTLARLVVVAVMATTFVLSQESDVSEPLARRIEEARRWRQKLEHLQEVMSRALVVNEKAEYVFSLLSKENQLIADAYLEKQSLPEGYSDPYYTTLGSHALELYRQDRQREYFEILATSSYNVNSPFSLVLAQDGIGNLDFLIDASRSHRVDITRGRLLWMIFRVRDSQGISKERSEEVLSTGMERLDDPSAYVRVKAIDELSRVKTDNVRARLLDARRTPQTDQFVRSQMELKKLDDAIASFGP